MALFKFQYFAICLVACSLQLKAEDDVCKELIVNGGSNWFPYFYRSNSEHYGIVGDIVLQASSRINIKPIVGKQTPWKRILFDLKNGQIDVVAGALKTKEREKIFTFSNPVYYSEFHIFVRKDNQFKFTELEDLIGKRGIKIRGMSLGQQLDEYAFENFVLEEVTDTDSLFKMVAAKRVDYGIFYLHSGSSELQRLKLDQSLIALQYPLTQQPLYVAFSKKSRCPVAVQQLSREIDLMNKDGSIEKIAGHYAPPAYYARPANNERVIENDE